MLLMWFAAGSKLVMKGRYGHVAGVVLNDTLLISGGYRGSVVGDLLALKLPPSITGIRRVIPSIISMTHCSTGVMYSDVVAVLICQV